MGGKSTSAVNSADKNSPHAAHKKPVLVPQRVSGLFKDVLSNIGVGVYIVQEGKFVFVNPLFESNSGYDSEFLIGKNPLDFIYPEDRGKTRMLAIESLKKMSEKFYEYRFIKKSGEIIWILEKVSSIKYNGKPAALGSFIDINERKLMENSLRHSEDKYRNIIETIQDGYFEVNLAGEYTLLNDIICQDLQYSREELIGMDNRSYQTPENAKKTYQAFREVYTTGRPSKATEMEVIRRDGTTGVSEVSISLIRDSQGTPVGFRGISRDITERKELEKRIRHLATHDPLTGLPNRLMFSQLLNHAIEGAKRYNRKLAVFFIDLDHFKGINDMLGHQAGDQFLREIATHFRQTLRDADVVARLGGDEFVVMIEEIDDLTQVAAVAHKLLSAAMKPVSIISEECRISASIGISIFPVDAEDERALMRHADTAMYFAKGERKNHFRFYSGDMETQKFRL